MGGSGLVMDGWKGWRWVNERVRFELMCKVGGRCVKTVEDKRGLEIGGRRAGDK